MRLLFDQNLSPRLTLRLADQYPDVTHVAHVGLERATDLEVWEFAAARGYTIVTKDSDFGDISLLRGSPPKIVWLRLGNCTTGDVERVLRRAHTAIADFLDDSAASILELS